MQNVVLYYQLNQKWDRKAYLKNMKDLLLYTKFLPQNLL